LQNVQALLHAFGLYQPTPQLVSQERGYFIYDDAQSAIAFSPPSTRPQLPSAEPESDQNDIHYDHQIRPFEPSIFTLPSNAANKILSFCRLFRLEIVDSVAEAPLKTYARPSPPKRERFVEPRWQLWASSTCHP
jgi:hypothetical protein